MAVVVKSKKDTKENAENAGAKVRLLGMNANLNSKPIQLVKKGKQVRDLDFHSFRLNMNV